MSVFNKKKKEIDQQVISTLISEGCVINGDMKAPNFVRIDGHVTGDIRIDEGLILGAKGMVTGNIYTREMIVYGTVTGNIQTEVLKIQCTGKINGEIKTHNLQVEMGAVYNGKISTNGNISVNNEQPTVAKRITEPVAELA